MSIWSDLLSLHGYLTRVHGAHNEDCEVRRPATPAAEADRLREMLGCRSSSAPHPEPRGPLIGVRGLT